MRLHVSTLTLGLVLVLLAGCSGTSPERDALKQSTYRESLGVASRSQILEEANETLILRYGYRYQRSVNTGEDILLETEWLEDAALGDERAMGYPRVQTRIIVSARPRSRTTGAGTYSVDFEAEARLWQEGQWVRVPLSDERQAYFKEIADYLETRLNTGFRS